MAIAPADMRAEFPKDFAADTDDVLQRSIDRAYRQIGDAWGELADDGALYLAAHLRAVAKRGMNGASGMVTSKKVGEVEVTYAPAETSAGSLGSTGYGMEFLRMMYALPGARIAVDPSDNYYDRLAQPTEDFEDNVF
jgi:hypothetical protein